MSSPITYPVIVDDKDLDDAALWEMIDSASASHSSSKHKPLAINYHNRQSKPPPSPPPPPPSKFSTDGGEVVQDPWPYGPPRKIARISGSSSCETSPLAMVRTVQRTPTPPAKVYSSPEIGKMNEMKEISSYNEVSPRCFGRNDEENVNGMRHSLSGIFPTVSLFKEYQNAAMAILEKTDYTLISGTPYIKKTGWRKISCYFNISYEIRDKNIEFDGDRNVQRAEFVIRAHMHCYWFLFATLGVAGFQMDGALVIDAKRDFRNQIMMYQAQQRLEPKIKLVKTCSELGNIDQVQQVNFGDLMMNNFLSQFNIPYYLLRV